MTRQSSNKAGDTWYLDSYISRHIYNNKELFSDIWSKNYKFIMAEGKIIYSQEIGTVYLLLESEKTIMTLLNDVYALKYNSNLILLRQLRKSGILYHNHTNSIIFKQKKNTLRVANRYKISLFSKLA